MRNSIEIDHTHARAICRGIGGRLRAHLREDPELPASLRRQIDRLHEVDRRSDVPWVGFGDKPQKKRADEIDGGLAGHGDEKADRPL
jgi:hypothetical protein